MSLDTPKPGSSRETDVKQVDHNDSIRATYLTIDDLRDCGVQLVYRQIGRTDRIIVIDLLDDRRPERLRRSARSR